MEILPSLNSKEFFSEPPTFPATPAFPWALVSTACLSHNRDLHEKKVVYDHTRIASYRHLCVGNVGGEYGFWLLKGNECSSAGGFLRNRILSGSTPNSGKNYAKSTEWAAKIIPVDSKAGWQIIARLLSMR